MDLLRNPARSDQTVLVETDQIKGVNGSSGILYLILGIFGLGIVSYCLMQDTINKAIM